MKTKKRVKLMISTITILFLDFLFSVVNKLITSQTDEYNNYVLTGLGMLVIVVLFVPAISIPDLLNRVTEWVLSISISISTKVFQKSIAIYFIFLGSLFLLYVGFYWVWFDRVIFFDGATSSSILDGLRQGGLEVERGFKSLGGK